MAATDYDYSITRNQIIEQAYSKLGIFSLGQTLSAEQLENGVRNLNLMVQDWQNDHIFLWNISGKTFSTVISTASYTVTADAPILYIDKAYRIDSNGVYIPLESITWNEYTESLDANTGEPYGFVWSPVDSKVYLTPTPDAVYSIHVVCAFKGKDFDTSTGDGDFPERFHMALVYGLANLLADDSTLPISERQTLERKADFYIAKARRNDRERTDYTAVRGAF